MLKRIAHAFGLLPGLERTPEEQKKVERKSRHLTLYHFPGCPYCMIVRSRIRELRLPIRMKNIHKDAQALNDLIDGGGRKTVPCLRIDSGEGTEWMYEARDIIDYLDHEFT